MNLLTLFGTGLFGAAHGCTVGRGEEDSEKPPLTKIFYTNATMTKLDVVIPCPKKIQKHINHMTHSLNSKSATYVISKNTNVDCFLILNF